MGLEVAKAYQARPRHKFGVCSVSAALFNVASLEVTVKKDASCAPVSCGGVKCFCICQCFQPRTRSGKKVFPPRSLNACELPHPDFQSLLLMNAWCSLRVKHFKVD